MIKIELQFDEKQAVNFWEIVQKGLSHEQLPTQTFLDGIGIVEQFYKECKCEGIKLKV